MTVVSDAKLLLGITGSDQDALLTLLEARASNFIADYCGITADTAPDPLVTDLVVQYYTRLGADGIASRQIGDFRVDYEDLPEPMRARLQRLRKVKW